MFDNIQPSSVFAVFAVISSLALLGYFSWKTLITANLFQKGVTLYQQENYKNAEAAFRQVIAINSTNDVVHLLLGDTLMQQGRVEEATQQFQDVINRAPKKVDAYLRLSNALMRLERKESAIATLEQARDLLQAQRQSQKLAEVNRILEKLKKV
ncbi:MULTISPECIES: tetratricopeptide repeat protein [Nostocales]|uniref:Tetratricopeptide repeat protein n=4 Tax=Nostocales TaxID=1161 RepID=A0A8S9T761_9CYAN|nr:tetratricopeptide repeat protein [Tolypothrix bouteillei]KAF3887946.1 tetratricopeptide repeat protein [Tolypothrix bouteillei VB521301]